MGGEALFLGPVVKELAYPVVSAVGEVGVEIVGLHGHAHVHLPVGHLEELLNIHPCASGDGHHWHPKGLGEPVYIDMVPMLFYLIHKIQGYYHGPLQL